MARIPDGELERIKREVSVLERVRAAGIALKRHGADWIGLCPFHRDTNPSLVITPSKNLWHCLGACQAGGSVIDWVMRREGVSFRRAVEDLKNSATRGKRAERRARWHPGRWGAAPGGDRLLPPDAAHEF